MTDDKPVDAYVALRDEAGDFGSWLIGLLSGDRAEYQATGARQDGVDPHANLPKDVPAPMYWKHWRDLPGGRLREGREDRGDSDSPPMYRIVAAPLSISMAA
jgi:hypothetical protein